MATSKRGENVLPLKNSYEHQSKMQRNKNIAFTYLSFFIMLTLLIINIMKHKKKSFVEPLQKLLMDNVELKIMLCHKRCTQIVFSLSPYFVRVQMHYGRYYFFRILAVVIYKLMHWSNSKCPIKKNLHLCLPPQPHERDCVITLLYDTCIYMCCVF